MSGFYNITKVETKSYVNGVLVNEDEDSDLGTLLLRQDVSPRNNIVSFEIETNLPVKAWDEVTYTTGKLFWDASENDKTLGIILFPDDLSAITSTSLVFTITKNKKKTKELLWTNAFRDPSTDDYVVNHELYTIKLK